MINISDLRDKLADYPPTMLVIVLGSGDVRHIVNLDDMVLLSDRLPIGNCIKCGEYAYTSDSEDYFAVCPNEDENLYSFEVEENE